MQGIIDCYFIENDEIVLVDYKTDYVPQENGLDIIRESIGLETEYYTRALTQITGKSARSDVFICSGMERFWSIDDFYR